MAQQKLYTEEQVREILKSTHIHTDNDVNMILTKFTPIELPSDEEIEKAAEKESEVQGWGIYDGTSEQYGIKHSFINCAKWMKEQMLTKTK